MMNQIIVGLFENDEQVKETIGKLHSRGFNPDNGDVINVIDRSCLHLEATDDSSPRQVVVQEAEDDTVTLIDPLTGASIAPEVIKQGVKETLIDLNVSEEAAAQHAERVAEGEVLVI
ncbi:MAG: hypothetical protein R3264_15425, partial [Anaerolineae bacterium]|nr:hypothetical protein [Anaerolineae bacterium]